MLARGRGGAEAASLPRRGAARARSRPRRATCARPATCVFHLSVLVVLVGFAIGGLFGYKGGVIVIEGKGFSNDPTQYDDFVPGSLFGADDLDGFSVHGRGLRGRLADRGAAARAWRASSSRTSTTRRRRTRETKHLRPEGQPPADHRRHRGVPDRARLRAGRHDPRRQRRRGLQRPDDLPADRPDLRQSFGVVKAPDAQPGQIGLEGDVLPDVRPRRRPAAVGVRRPGQPAAVAVRLHRRPRARRRREPVGLRARQVERRAAHEGRRPAASASTCARATRSSCPTASARSPSRASSAGTRSRSAATPGKLVALAGVVLALVGLLGSLFIRPRRVWVRARRARTARPSSTSAPSTAATAVTRSAASRRARGDHGHAARRFRRRGARPRRARDQRIVGDR